MSIQRVADSISRYSSSGNMLSGLSQPRDWEEYANTVIPTVIKAAEGKASNAEVSTLLKCVISRPGMVVSMLTMLHRRRALDKRAIFERHSYTIVAIACADSVDPDPLLNMTQIFDEVANVTQNVSPTCELPSPLARYARARRFNTTSHYIYAHSRSVGAIWPTQWNHCLFWPVRAPERYQGPFNGTFANKILIIGNTYDPATPFSEAQHMAEVMGDQAALVRQDGFGVSSCAMMNIACWPRFIDHSVAFTSIRLPPRHRSVSRVSSPRI